MYFFLKEPNSDSRTLIYLIYYIKSERANFKYSTGLKIDPQEWNFDNRMPQNKRGGSGKKNKQLTNILNNYIEVLDDALLTLKDNNESVTKLKLRAAFDGAFKKVDVMDMRLTDYIQEFIDVKKRTEGKSRAWNLKFNNLKKKIELFEAKKLQRITFKDINQDLIDEYAGFLRTINTKPFKPHNDNTLNRNIVFLFTFLKWAKNKYSFDLSLSNPAKRYQSDDIHLTSEEVEVLENLVLESKQHEKVRDVFLIGVYSGQRYSDYSVFEKADIKGDLIIKRAEKTEKESFIPLHPKLKDMLEKYEWKIPKISSQKFNTNIQKVCELAEINEDIKITVYRGNKKEVLYKKKYEIVSSHTARRTFITLSSERGMPDHIIMKITGIRDPKTLIKYKKTNQQTVSDFANKIWG